MEKKKKILIIDDNPLIVEDFLFPLREDYDILVNCSVKHSSRLLELNHYDLIILDIMMPASFVTKNEYTAGFDYYSFYLRTNHPEIKVVFWSGLTYDTFIHYFADKGKIPANVYFLQKKYWDINHLKEFVDFIFSKK